MADEKQALIDEIKERQQLMAEIKDAQIEAAGDPFIGMGTGAQHAMGTLPVLAKAMDMVDVPALLAARKLMGLPPIALSKGFDLTNPEMIPGYREMLMEKGVSGNISQDIPKAVNPFKDNPSSWSELQKGGPLDISRVNAYGIPLDIFGRPSTYLSSGESLAIKNAAKTSARMVARRVPSVGFQDRAKDVAKTMFVDNFKSAPGTSAWGKLKNVARATRDMVRPLYDPLGMGIETLGRGMYNSAYSELDNHAIAYGLPRISTTYMNPNNVYGGVNSTRRQLQDLKNPLLDKTQATYQALEDAGATIDVPAAVMPTFGKMVDYVDEPFFRKYQLPRVLEKWDLANTLGKEAKPKLVFRARKNLDDTISSEAHVAGAFASEEDKVNRSLRSDLQRSLEDTATDVLGEGEGDLLRVQNKEMGSYISADDVLKAITNKTPLPMSTVTGLSLGVTHPQAVARMMNNTIGTMPALSMVGKGLQNMGSGRVLGLRPFQIAESLGRQYLTEDQKPTWSLMRGQE